MIEKGPRPLHIPSIRFIVLYFGTLPDYFDLWMESCRLNNQIDWLVITDDAREFETPPNVVIKKCSFDDCVKKIKSAIDIVPSKFQPYKLCDFRPAFGEIFKEELQGYDFWGHCDLDLICGNIANFLPEDIFKQYSMILFCGHFKLYRNTKEVNNYFRRQLKGLDYNKIYAGCRFQRREGDILDYRNIFASSHGNSFDEWGGINIIYKECGLPMHDNWAVVADIDPWRERFNMVINANTRHQLFAWVNGRIMCYQLLGGEIKSTEYMYMHFQKRTMPRGAFKRGSNFYITPTGFIEMKSSLPSVKDIKSLSRPPLKKWHHTREVRLWVALYKDRLQLLKSKCRQSLKRLTKKICS